MRRFAFRLETLLRVRRLREQEIKRRFGMKLAEIARVDGDNLATSREIEAQQQALRRRQSETNVDPSDLARGRAWIAHLRKTIVQRRILRQSLTQELEAIRTDLRRAQTDTKSLEKLRERRHGEYQDARERREQATIDEVAQQLYVRIGVQSSE
ncbi:flagellar biosynthesis chaperone [Phycisphaerae bacterium RAS1]|nr:flagellar biosynthesis chaperone [Phycisphaerae bacterium RAS1]